MSEQPATSQRVTAAEAAAILGVSTTTIRRMVKRGELEGERVHRPQGTAFVVTLPAAAPHAAGDAAPTQQVADAPPRGNASPATQLAAWSETFLVPLVAALERSQETIRDQAETIGRQSERVAGLETEIGRLESELTAERAAKSMPAASGAPETGDLPQDPPIPLSRLLTRWLVLALVLVGVLGPAVALLVWPR
jgi:excisionase family DNA binding protein